MKWLAGALLTVVLLLQYRLWLSGDGVRELARLSDAVERQKAENEEAVDRKQQLIAEVADLKAGMAARWCRSVRAPRCPRSPSNTRRPPRADVSYASHALFRRHPGRGQRPSVLRVRAEAIRGSR